MPNYSQTKQYLETFASLPTGWHYGEGAALSKTAIGIIADLLLKASQLGFERFDAFPGVDGEVQFTIYAGLNFYSITFESNAEFTVFHERNRQEVFRQERATFHDVAAKLEDFAFQLWNTPESPISSTSPPKTGAQATSPSENQRTEPESPASTSPVPAPTLPVDRFAIISDDFTLQSVACHRSIGSYQQVLTLIAVGGSRTTENLTTLATTT